MPPIPIYASSPINATKASGVTPQTAHPEDQSSSPSAKRHAGTTTTATATATQPYPAAQPGAVPSLPAPTGTVQFSDRPSNRNYDDLGPPPPQPGAVPVLPGATSTLPPPPKAGQTYQPPEQTHAPRATMPYPPQMSIPPPNMAYSAQRGSSTSTYQPQMTGPMPTPLGLPQATSLDHPPGYQQNVNASELSSYQRAAHDASEQSAARRESYGGMEEGVWDTAKKWAQAAGGSIAAAEDEVWRRINKE